MEKSSESESIWLPADVFRSLIEGAVERADSRNPLPAEIAPYHIAFDILDAVERSADEYAEMWGWSKEEVIGQWAEMHMQASTWEATKVHRDQLK